jgi:hypothetical protein
MGLNLSNEQIAHELDLNSDDAQKMPGARQGFFYDLQPHA